MVAKQSGEPYTVTVQHHEVRSGGSLTITIAARLRRGSAYVNLLNDGDKPGTYSPSGAGSAIPEIVACLHSAILAHDCNGAVKDIQLLLEFRNVNQLEVCVAGRAKDKLPQLAAAIQQAMQKYTKATVRLIVSDSNRR